MLGHEGLFSICSWQVPFRATWPAMICSHVLFKAARSVSERPIRAWWHRTKPRFRTALAQASADPSCGTPPYARQSELRLSTAPHLAYTRIQNTHWVDDVIRHRCEAATDLHQSKESLTREVQRRQPTYTNRISPQDTNCPTISTSRSGLIAAQSTPSRTQAGLHGSRCSDLS